MSKTALGKAYNREHVISAHDENYQRGPIAREIFKKKRAHWHFCEKKNNRFQRIIGGYDG